MGTYAGDLQTLSLGLLVARVIIGFLMAAHGTQKLVTWFGGFANLALRRRPAAAPART